MLPFELIVLLITSIVPLFQTLPYTRVPPGTTTLTAWNEPPDFPRLLNYLENDYWLRKCGLWKDPNTETTKMLGGREANEGEWPTAVALQLVAGDTHREANGQEYIAWCTGSLISPRHVLTAAHCFYMTHEGYGCTAGAKSILSFGYTYMARFGQLTLPKLNDDHALVKPIVVKNVYVPEQFDFCADRHLNTSYYDIAIAELADDVPVSAFFPVGPLATLCLGWPNGKEPEPHENHFDVYGYGYDPHARREMSTLKTESKVRLGTRCNLEYHEEKLAADMICVDESGVAGCRGDSGSPIVSINRRQEHNWDPQRFIVGVLSRGTDCDELSYTRMRGIDTSEGAAYTRVHDHVVSGWICHVTGLCGMTPFQEPPTTEPPVAVHYDEHTTTSVEIVDHKTKKSLPREPSTTTQIYAIKITETEVGTTKETPSTSVPKEPSIISQTNEMKVTEAEVGPFKESSSSPPPKEISIITETEAPKTTKSEVGPQKLMSSPPLPKEPITIAQTETPKTTKAEVDPQKEMPSQPTPYALSTTTQIGAPKTTVSDVDTTNEKSSPPLPKELSTTTQTTKMKTIKTDITKEKSSTFAATASTS